MSTHRGLHTRRQRVVLGLAAAAAVAGIVGVAYLGWVAPPEPDATTGAIGAVRKYRAPQIGDADVVLAGQEARVPYEAVLEDAVALQQVGTALAQVGMSSAGGTVVADMAAADERLEQRLDTVRARLAYGVRIQRAALGEFLTTHGALMPKAEGLTDRVEAVAADEPTAETMALQGLVMELGRVLPALETDGLAAVTAALERVAGLGDAAQPGETELAAVTTQLEDAAQALAVRDAGLDYGVLLARQRYLGLLTQEMATLGAARREIEATRATMDGASADDVRGRLGALGTALGARAERLANLGVGALQAQYGGMEIGLNDQVDALGPQFGGIALGANNQADPLGPQFGGGGGGRPERPGRRTWAAVRGDGSEREQPSPAAGAAVRGDGSRRVEPRAARGGAAGAGGTERCSGAAVRELVPLQPYAPGGHRDTPGVYAPESLVAAARIADDAWRDRAARAGQ